MPKLGTRDECIKAGLEIAEYGLEYLSYKAIGDRIGITGAGVKYHFENGAHELRAAVIELAYHTNNRYVLGQLWAMRPLPASGVLR